MATEQRPHVKYLDTLNKVHTRLDRLGDLPVFSATINRIQQISSSPESDAMALAMAVMKDANLSAKLLKLANSSHINRGKGRIKVISRAVIMIGFDEIKNISVTLKLIECFNDQNPGADISKLVLRSFLTGAIARELGAKCGLDDIEATYTCGLLHGLGEIVVAYTLPEIYQKMTQLREQKKHSWSRIQLEILGGHFGDIGQDLAQSWGFPSAVVHSMDEMTAEDLNGEQHTNYMLASRSQHLLESLYQGGEGFSGALKELSKVTKLDQDALTGALSRSFRNACDLTEEYGISAKRLLPPVSDTGDDAQDEFSRKLAFYIHSREEREDLDSAPRPRPAPVMAADNQQLATQLRYMQQLSELVSNQAPLTQVLAKSVEAIGACCPRSRTAFCLLTRDHQQIALKLFQGQQRETLSHYFNMHRDRSNEFIFRLVEKQSTLLVNDVREPGWRERLPAAFIEQVNPCGFILAPLGIGKRVIGFLYADHMLSSGPIADSDFRAFSQFHMQARIALGYSQH